MPLRVIGVAAAALVAVVGIAAIAVALEARGAVTVPDVTGLQESVARVSLAQSGLAMIVDSRPFDITPAGTVLSQQPEPGLSLKRGEPVRLVVSAGTEEFLMPDVVGLNIRIAQAQLEQKGLVVRVEPVESDAPKDTVISSNPSPGVTVRTADIVRLTVAADSGASDVLLPYTLSGFVFVIDPSEVTSGSIDVPLEVSRRLQSLLEASGATVHITRSGNATDTTVPGRVAALSGLTPNAVIGLDVSATGEGGMGVFTLTQAAGGASFATSSLLADEIARELRDLDSGVDRSTIGSEPVLAAAGVTGARISLGSPADAVDASAFREPTWADGVARAIYRGIGERLAPL